jgi:hypothetical protein
MGFICGLPARGSRARIRRLTKSRRSTSHDTSGGGKNVREYCTCKRLVQQIFSTRDPDLHLQV